MPSHYTFEESGTSAHRNHSNFPERVKEFYQSNGYQDIVRPGIRPAGEGGCGDGRTDLETFRTRPLEKRAFV